VYAGTKAYVDCFSRSLDGEYAPLGVRVQNQAPMFVATKMSKIR
jgi:17beta-estradiol 17-dehydrogenase / very-long-chain 3-oxoacyl-CoA reductase